MIIALGLKGQQNAMSFSHLSAEDGFPDNMVYAILMDNKGYMWFGTGDDLIRWDGNNFTTFEVDEDDPSSLSSRVVLDLLEDSQGYIWVATVGGGLNRYDPETEKFKVYTHDPNNSKSISGNAPVSLFIDSDSIMWIGTFNKGFNRFDPKTEEFENINLDDDLSSEDDAFNRNSVHEIIEDVSDSNILWLAGDNGLYRYNKSSKELLSYPSTFPLTSGTSVQELFMDTPGELWLGTYGMGIVLFNTIDRTWNYCEQTSEGQQPLNRGVVLGLAEKSAKELWVSTIDFGFGVLDKETHTVEYWSRDCEQKYGILETTSNKVYVDPQDRVWILHDKKGISYSSKDGKLFQFHDLGLDYCEGSGGYFNITDFEYDPSRNLIYVVSSTCDGFTVYNDKLEMQRRVLVKGGENTYQFFNTICRAKDGTIWVGANSQKNTEEYYRPTLVKARPDLSYLDAFNPPELDAIGMPDASINDILEDKKGRMWFAADPIGLVCYDNGKVSVFNPFQEEKGPNFTINQILEDDKGNLWLATMFHRLIYYNPDDGTYVHYNHESIIETDLDGIALGKDGALWIGHGRGIQIIYPGTGPNEEIELYEPVDKTKSAVIDNILIDKNQNVWVTTKKGLILFNKEVESFVVLDEFDGLDRKFFFSHGIKEMPWGEILVGQNDGFYSFNPSKVFDKLEVPAVVFDQIKVFQEKKEFDKNINALDKIELDYEENFFTISFSVLSYDQPSKCSYAYYLEGFDKDWIYSDNRNIASYTNVGEGNYTFKVKAADRRGIWHDEPISLQIIIRPPWYRTTIAYIGYFLLASLLAGLIYWYQRWRWQIRLQLKLKEQEASKFRQLDVAKTRLYTNITHEFRTPLTIILGIADKIEQSPKQWVERGIRMIKRNSSNLLFLVNQMLDLSKLESESLKVNLVQGNIMPYLKYITESFHSYSETKNIRMHFLTEVEEVIMDYDIEKVMNILSNLLSNAIKFTPAGGNVYLSIDQVAAISGGTNLQVKVKDTGVGIPENKLPFIFDRFYQADDSATRHGEGTGIGLALTKELVKLLDGEISVKSTLHKGTEFTLLLPIKNAAPISETFIDETMEKEINSMIVPEAIEKAAYSRSDSSVGQDAPLLLIVEDNPDIAKYLIACLEGNYQLEIAYNGQDGVDRALELVPDLVLSDVMMPEKNGFELCNELKTDMRTSHIPIILLTAKADVESKLSGLQRGADAYMAKPFNEEELLIRIKNLLNLRQSLQSKYASPEQIQALSKKKPKAVGAADSSIEDAFIQKVREVIESHIDDYDLDVSKLCRALGLSRTPLHNKLKALTGKSTTEFIRFIRLNKARSLLLETDLNISEIAFETGFRNHNYFTKMFGALFGISPTDFREANR